MLKHRTIMAWGILLSVVLVPPLVRSVIAASNPPTTPLSKAIVEALDLSPRGLTIVSEDLCDLATQDAMAKSIAELRFLDAVSSNVGGPLAPEGTVLAEFKKSNGLFEGVQKLWLYVNDEQQFCRAKIQTYSW